MVTRLGLVCLIAACGAHAHGKLSGHAKPGSAELTLYRDHAVVAQHVIVNVPPASTATVRLRVAAGVHADDVYVIDRGTLTIQATRGIGASPPAPARAPEPEPVDPCAEEPPDADPKPLPHPVDPAPQPSEIELVVAAPSAGSYPLVIGYDTERITWDAAYTMTTTAARDRVTLQGAIAIRNATGLALRDAEVWVVDADHGPATSRIAERLGSKLVGADPGTTPIAKPRDLGRLDLVEGDTRVELVASAAPRPMRSVLVYDPIGTKLDHASPSPVRDASLGVHPPAPSRVEESFEIPRDEVATRGLPGGPVRLLERRADGSLAVLGEARLFDIATADARVDTVAVGTATGVTGKRVRRELTLDEEHKRLVEEFVITLDNARDQPVEVMVREHLYRGQNWTLAYHSARSASKEGPQQITLRTRVPAKASTKLLYVVVYTW
ncbi:MAG TPA: hypothetical protein VFQ53_03675 [Kofleriaceae bacterium]|nr:hypothetical protein [Kofleriaceae bacterium]